MSSGGVDLRNLFRLDGKVAVVVGGTGDIGKIIAMGLAAYGAKVVIVGTRDLAKIKEIAKSISSEVGSEVEGMRADMTVESEAAALKDEVVSKYGTVDILVNSQGYNVKYNATEFPASEWDKLYAINVKSVMLSCREFGKVMIAKRSGKIINMSSVRGARATKWAGNIGYSSTKGAVDMLTRQLAAEWAPYNVNVNAIAPVLVATQTGMGAANLMSEEHIKKYLPSIPMGRIAVPEDMVGVAVFLASRASDFITGQIIYVDGGLTAVG